MYLDVYEVYNVRVVQGVSKTGAKYLHRGRTTSYTETQRAAAEEYVNILNSTCA
jgi:uncharacterized protein (DUF1330 family)